MQIDLFDMDQDSCEFRKHKRHTVEDRRQKRRDVTDFESAPVDSREWPSLQFT